MKMKILYNFLALAFLAFVFQSRSGGPATVAGLQATGAPGEITCANTGCHAQGAFEPSITIELLDGPNAVTEYTPGNSYTVRITGNAGSGTPSIYGFQATSLDAGENQAGSWGDVGMDNQVATAGGKSYVEHATPSSDNFFEVEWIAPAGSTGEVTIYASVLLSNGNGNFQGDGGANGSLTVTENVSSVFSVKRDYANLSIFPNPVENELNLEITSRNAGNYTLRFLDVSGQVIRTEQTFLNSGENQKVFEVNDLNKGFYIIQLCGDQHIASTEMLKM